MVASPENPKLDDLRAGSESAWSAAVRLLGPTLRGFLRARGTRDPEEILADVFLDLARIIDTFEGDWDAFRTLAFVVARRRIIDDYRHTSRRPSDPVDPGCIARGMAGGDVEVEAMAQMGHAWVLELLRILTPIQREVVTMRFVLGLSIREVAAITETTETSVKANQRRALDSLRRHLALTTGPVANGRRVPGIVP